MVLDIHGGGIECEKGGWFGNARDGLGLRRVLCSRCERSTLVRGGGKLLCLPCRQANAALRQRKRRLRVALAQYWLDEDVRWTLDRERWLLKHHILESEPLDINDDAGSHCKSPDATDDRRRKSASQSTD